jgi:uncharacterized protein YneF (UPF0154 family)
MNDSEQTKHRTGYIFLLIFVLLAVGIVTGAYVVRRKTPDTTL